MRQARKRPGRLDANGLPRGYLARIDLTEAEVERFRSKYTEGAPDECWPWQGPISKNGYGAFKRRPSTLTASRVAWFLANGRQPLGLVCHTCDNPPCVNPAHLWVGDFKDNSEDMVRKGRHPTIRCTASRTHCGNGHRFTPESTRYYRGSPVCRLCNRAACERYRARRAASARGAA